MALWEFLAVLSLLVIVFLAAAGIDPVKWVKKKCYELIDEFYKATGW